MLSLWNDLLNLIFPPRLRCPFCDGPAAAGEICGRCRAAVEDYRREPRCARCGRLPGSGAASCGGGAAGLCRECRGRDWPFVLACSAGPYEGVLKEAIHRFKYAGRRGLARPLAGLMAAAALAEPRLAPADLLVPVPLAGGKLRQRGFNQAELLAREVGALLRIPVDGRSLVKTVDTPPQAGLPRSARESNLKDAFQVTNAGNIRGRNILLVDDVFTTGMTMSAAAAALARFGAGRVFGLTVAAGRYF
ncbi:MAG: ComF family protein [Peptococcaceae bacterium]|nr:ComF family protein [Peptococcaceae bacterium]